MRFYACYGIPATPESLGGIMKNFAQSLARGERPAAFAQGEHGEAVLGDAERKIPFGVAAPAIGSGDPNRKILVGPCVGSRIENTTVQPPLWRENIAIGALTESFDGAVRGTDTGGRAATFCDGGSAGFAAAGSALAMPLRKTSSTIWSK